MVMEGKIIGHWETRIVTINGHPLDEKRSQKVWNRSPDGFNWGYGGSGPAQLALAILLEFVGKDLAVAWHQDFLVLSDLVVSAKMKKLSRMIPSAMPYCVVSKTTGMEVAQWNHPPLVYDKPASACLLKVRPTTKPVWRI